MITSAKNPRGMSRQAICLEGRGLINLGNDMIIGYRYGEWTLEELVLDLNSITLRVMALGDELDRRTGKPWEN